MDLTSFGRTLSIRCRNANHATTLLERLAIAHAEVVGNRVLRDLGSTEGELGRAFLKLVFEGFETVLGIAPLRFNGLVEPIGTLPRNQKKHKENQERSQPKREMDREADSGYQGASDENHDDADGPP